MIGRLEVYARRIRRWFSRSEWLARWLKLSRSVGTSSEPGLLLVQIDGLSRKQLEAALHAGRMPFLSGLRRKEGYQLHPFYSGLPSSTPGVQGELFYGVRGAVPAFSFRDKNSNQIVRMFDQDAASRVQQILTRQGEPLLEGEAYCDIYSGGAAEPHFCSATTGWGDFLSAANYLAVLSFMLWNIFSLFRVAILMIFELVLAAVDFFRGLIERQDLVKELNFVPTRVLIVILLRELLAIGASIDVTRGLPIVHVNFLGYDEQAHRRGPSSAFAHWSLLGIDQAIRRIWSTARRSNRRDYDIWIYSDHGQEATVPYETENGRTIHAALADVFCCGAPRAELEKSPAGEQLTRAKWLRKRRRGPVMDFLQEPEEEYPFTLAAMGPLAHLYLQEKLTVEEKLILAEQIQRGANIPLVLFPDESGERLHAFTGRGRFLLPEDAAEVFGGDHPFLSEVTSDMIALCRHESAGDFVLSGMRVGDNNVDDNKVGGKNISFPQENGAHAGPGPEETGAFLLAPVEVFGHSRSVRCLRPSDLRAAALHRLGRGPAMARAWPRRRGAHRDTIRIMTYNVHSCIGMDGKISPSRIAKVIARFAPDVVALQELDLGRLRTGEIDQAHQIARELEMEFHFHPSLKIEEEAYGNAILSHFPMQLMHAVGLPGLKGREPRGAMWVNLDVHGQSLQLMNTHLGLSGRERMMQVESLLGPEWLEHPVCRAPLVLCGDMNASPNSRTYRNFAEKLRDVQTHDGRRPKQTWLTFMPLRRIDHIFFLGEMQVRKVAVPRLQLIRVASDHFPLVVDLRLPRK